MTAGGSPGLGVAPGVVPDALYVLVDGLSDDRAWGLAVQATKLARTRVPRLTGRAARSLWPYYGAGFFGVRWSEPHLWYAEAGTRPRTMRSLAGKTIPMWVADEDGSLRRADPKIKKRVTEDGRQQVLIFRKAARIGQRKGVVRRVGGARTVVSVPASYPGAPGRIARRTESGRVDAGNVGVRWRHPGAQPGRYLTSAIADVAQQAGLGQREVHATLRRT